jgi:hypothetical protein
MVAKPDSLTVMFESAAHGAWSLPIGGYTAIGMTVDEAREFSRRNPDHKVRWILGDEMRDFINGSPV